VSDEAYRHPYTPYPGSSTPEATVGPHEGKQELWAFFWLAVLNTVIIGVAMVGVWWMVH